MVLDRAHPNFVTEETRRKVYEDSIKIRIRQGVEGFAYAVRFMEGHYEDAVLCLQDAEQWMGDARERGYNPDTSLLKEGIEAIALTVNGNFRGSAALFSYLGNSGIDLAEYREHLEKTLPVLAQKYANHVLAMSRRTAKRMKRKKPVSKRIAEDFDKIEGLRQYGVDEGEKMAELREVAYQRGVVFFLKTARDYAYDNRKRSVRALHIAERNAEALGKDISREVKEIEEVYASKTL